MIRIYSRSRDRELNQAILVRTLLDDLGEGFTSQNNPRRPFVPTCACFPSPFLHLLLRLKSWLPPNNPNPNPNPALGRLRNPHHDSSCFMPLLILRTAPPVITEKPEAQNVHGSYRIMSPKKKKKKKKKKETSSQRLLHLMRIHNDARR